ncbi:efflux RND transporter permease subunit [Treponema pectinovorum]|uniref:efflux RND transporter permease subunit n=1 Tax=Treponema pectinovorum TaxID=164 RepID=UPI0011F151B7|nr:efflux RND transporter permease subunit [Treponema pectinovorum]
MSISKKILDHPVLTLIVFALLGIIGLFTLKNVAISLMPDVDFPYINVRTTYKNAGPESVEKSVTKILEAQLVSVSGLKSITSTSSEGSSSISLEFNYGTDLESATNDIRDKISRATKNLPDGVDPPSIFKMDSNSMPIMRIAIRGNRSNDDLKTIAEDQIVDLLEQVDGVAEATVSGGRTKILRVDISQNRLSAYGLTMAQVASALAKQNLELGGGKISDGVKDYTVRTTGEFSSVEEVKETIITTVNNYVVRLGDLGNVYLGFEDRTSEVYINGQPGVYVSITKQSGKNTVTVANATRKKLAEVQQLMPGDVVLEVISDDSQSISDTIGTLMDSAYSGLILAIIILFLFLKSGKSTLIIAISIPLSIIITLLAMNFAGITLNMMTLTGLILGVGMIVDASIVMIENIYVYRSRGAQPKVAAVLGSQEMIMSVVSGNLTTICVFLPFIFFISDLGMMGQMFKGIIFTVVIALISSLFVAVFLVPVLAGKFLPLTNRQEKPIKFKPLARFYELLELPMTHLTALYRKALKTALSHRAVTTIVCVSLLAISLILIPTLKVNMVNNGTDSSVTMNLTLANGTPLAETEKILKDFEKIIEDEIQGYTTVITSIGTGRGSSTTNKGSIQINLPETEDQIDTSVTIQQKLRKHFADYPGARFTFSQGFARQMTGSEFKIYVSSDDLDSALDIADKVRTQMEKIADIGEVSIDTEEGLPEVQVVIDRQRAYSFGVDVTTVAKEINYAINGVTATTYRQNGKEYSLVLLYDKEDRKDVTNLEQIYVAGKTGMVSVANFAEVKKGLGPVSIRRENQTRRVTVPADKTSERRSSEIIEEIKNGIKESFVVPEGVSIIYDGAWKDTKEQGITYLLIALMAILLVFGVMAGTYESFKAPIINLTTIPFLIIGVVLIFKFTGQAFSMTSAVGVIMLVGIVVNNGIILVDYTSLLLERGYKMKDACLQAGASRLRPVLMTTLTTILGMLPMCFASSGSAAMVQPIAVAVVGGLTSSTLVTLFFIPVLFSLVMKEKQKEKSRIKLLLTKD